MPKDAVTVEEFFKNNKMKIDIFNSKYSKHGETVDECFRRISEEISNADFKDEQEKNYWINRWTDEFLNDIWRPGGSIISSTNNPTKKISTFNCTGYKIPEDTLESIFETRYNVAKSAAYRQGTGVDFSNIRPRGSAINNSAEISEGVISWMKSFDNIANEVGQLGRKPAMLFSLNIKHPDIIEFISCKDDLDSINNANISIQITDKFMKAVEEDDFWNMNFELDDGKSITKSINARKLLNIIADHSHGAAEPGLLFIDTMKKRSMQESFGYNVETCNACSEKPLPSHGVCCLSSINMAKVPKLTDKNFKSFIQNITRSMVRFMDNVNEYEIKNSFKSPLTKQYETVKDLREIGLGITNLHQWLYDQGLGYDTDTGINAIEEFFKSATILSSMAFK